MTLSGLNLNYRDFESSVPVAEMLSSNRGLSSSFVLYLKHAQWSVDSAIHQIELSITWNTLISRPSNVISLFELCQKSKGFFRLSCDEKKNFNGNIPEKGSFCSKNRQIKSKIFYRSKMGSTRTFVEYRPMVAQRRLSTWFSSIHK